MQRPSADIEPLLTMRCHDGPVNSVILSTFVPSCAEISLQERLQNGTAFSSGYDGQIHMWGLPRKDVSPYKPFGTLVSSSSTQHKDNRRHSIARLSGHKDSVWDMKLHSIQPCLASCSADGTVNLWNLDAIDCGGGVDELDIWTGGVGVENSEGRSVALRQTLTVDGVLSVDKSAIRAQQPTAIPTSLDFVHTDLSQLLVQFHAHSFVNQVSFSNSSLCLFDIEIGTKIATLEGADSSYDKTSRTQINRVIAHRTMALAVTAHEDRRICFFDTRSAKLIHSMVAHLEGITTLDLSPNGQIIVSAGSSVNL